ncbi:hypothetical protein KAT63_00020 [Candidatus Parcubacteria bacterium]|nr:hypothetical protein [Candidatus Parcubacteria bacterium]
MNFSKKILKEIKKKKEIAFEIFIVIIFIFTAVSIFSGINPMEKDIPNYEKLLENNLKEYNSEINKIRNRTEKSLNSSQLDKMKEYEDLLRDDVYKKRKKDPFYKSY